MNRKSQSPQSSHPFAHLRSKITLQPNMKSSQNLHDSRCEKPRLTEFRLEFKAKVTTSNALATSTHKQSDGKLDKQDKSNHRHKNSPMYASFIPSSKVQLSINLVHGNDSKHIKFQYSNQTIMSELTSYLRSMANLQHIIFRSGDIMIDHLLTLDNQKVSLLKFSQPLTLRPQPIITEPTPENSLKRFNILKCIGAGGFSKVFLAEVYGTFVALKVIDKRSLLQDSKSIVIHNERKVLLALDHPFIAHMHYALQTQRYIVIALEYCCGGELFYHLRKQKRLKETEAKFYFVELLLALKAMHEKGIVYRDLKPQNVILDASGHVRLTDFGLSKFLTEDQLTHSFCGSAEYMAPEMLSKSGHSFSIDFYCLGALLYQLVTGLPPYYSTNTDILYDNILRSPVEFPPDAQLSPQIRSLLSQLLIKDPDRRLGSCGGVSEIVAHPWLSSVSMIEVLSKRIPPPIKPGILVYNFDDVQFKQGEQHDIEELNRQKTEGDLKQAKFGSFFFESQQMRRKRQFFQQSQFGNINGMRKKVTKPIQSGTVARENDLLSKSPHAAEGDRKLQPNTNRLRNNKYYLQPYHKYGSSSPAIIDSRNGSEVLKYRLPASTKTLLHGERQMPSTDGRRQYSQQLTTQPFHTSKDYLLGDPSRDNSAHKYSNLNSHGDSSDKIKNKYLNQSPSANGLRTHHNWNTIHTTSATTSTSASKLPARNHHNDYGRRNDSPMGGGLLKNNKQQQVDKNGSSKLLSQHSELRKGYFNKDKIKNYLAGVYKH